MVFWTILLVSIIFELFSANIGIGFINLKVYIELSL